MNELNFGGCKVDVRLADNKDRQMQELEKALKIFKRKCEKDNIIRIIKGRKFYTKPSEEKRAKLKQAKKRRI